MNVKKFIACAAAIALCVAFAACGSSSDSSSRSESSAAETTSTAESAAENTSDGDTTESETDPVGTTDYDVNGSEREYDKLAEKYAEGYTIELSAEMAGMDITMNFTKSGDQVYQSTVMAGMKSYVVIPGDGMAYSVSEATTTYAEEEESEEMIVSLDFLFGATGEFASADIDETTNTVYEHYTLNYDVAQCDGEIIFGFNGESYELTEVQIAYDGAEENEVYTVTSLGEPDMSLLEMPDLSAYTKS